MTRSKDFVEIQPVRLTDTSAEPVYGEEVRGAKRVTVNGPGQFSTAANPDHVPGAYENLKHYQLRAEIEERGLAFEIGRSHLFPIDDVLAGGQVTLTSDGNYLHGILPGLLGAAARAGLSAGATHVEVKIS